MPESSTRMGGKYYVNRVQCYEDEEAIFNESGIDAVIKLEYDYQVEDITSLYTSRGEIFQRDDGHS